MTTEKIAKDFNIKNSHVWTLKSQYNMNCEELYNELSNREKAVIECQMICADLTARDIVEVFKDKKWSMNSARGFLYTLYRNTETYYKKDRYETTKKVLDYLRKIL